MEKNNNFSLLKKDSNSSGGDYLKAWNYPQSGFDYFLLLLSKSSIWSKEKHFFLNYHIFFWYIKMCHELQHLIWGIWQLHRSKDFEAMKAGKLAIRPWMSCQYTKNTLMDKPCHIWFDNSTLLKLHKLNHTNNCIAWAGVLRHHVNC